VRRSSIKIDVSRMMRVIHYDQRMRAYLRSSSSGLLKRFSATISFSATCTASVRELTPRIFAASSARCVSNRIDVRSQAFQLLRIYDNIISYIHKFATLSSNKTCDLLSSAPELNDFTAVSFRWSAFWRWREVHHCFACFCQHLSRGATLFCLSIECLRDGCWTAHLAEEQTST